MADPKKSTVPADRPRKITVEGIELTVEPDIFDDVEVLDWLGQMQDVDQDAGGIYALPRLLRRLCGKSYARVLDHLRGEDGRVSVTDASRFITSLIGKANPNS